MGKPKFTPGPWIADVDSDNDSAIIYSVNGKRIGEAQGSDNDIRIDRVNAQLIAAAPEMLVELQNYLKRSLRETDVEAYDRVCKLIAKATGGAE